MESNTSANTSMGCILENSLLPPRNKGDDDYPQCRCWLRLKSIEDEKRRWPKTLPLNTLLSPIRHEVARCIQTLNALFALVRDHHEDFSASTLPSPQAQESFNTYRSDIMNSIDVVMVMITNIPGYVCGKCSPHHRDVGTYVDALRQAEEVYKREAEELQSIDSDVEAIAVRVERMRRRTRIQYIVRTACILVVPYSPVLSAVFTLLDFFALSLPNALYEESLSGLEDQCHRVQADLEETKARVYKWNEEVPVLLEHYERLQAKFREWERLHPESAQLGQAMDCAYATKHALRDVLFRTSQCGTCDVSTGPISTALVPSTVSLTTLSKTFEALAEALEAPNIVGGLLASLTAVELASCVDTVAAFNQVQ